MSDHEHVRRAFNSAIDFALDDCDDHEATAFLRCWREGDWKAIADQWPEFDLSTVGAAQSKR